MNLKPTNLPRGTQREARSTGALNLNLNPCAECGKTDRLKIASVSIGCHRCMRFCVTTETPYLAWTWNTQNPARESRE